MKNISKNDFAFISFAVIGSLNFSHLKTKRLMAPNFELTYSLDDLKPEKLVQNCRLRVTVSWRDIVMMEKDFFYCLHCQKVFSRTGFYYHKFRFSYTLREVEVIAADFVENQSRHDLLLKNEFERRFENGKMRRVTYVQPMHQQTITITPHPLPFEPPPARMVRPAVRRPRVVEPVPDNEEPQRQDQPIDVFDEVQDDFPDLFDCFSNKGFDPYRFEDYIKDFFGQFSERVEKKTEKSKRRRRRLSRSWHNTSTSCAPCQRTR